MRRGFTIIELLFVMSVMVIMVGFGVSMYMDSVKQARETSLGHDLKNVIAEETAYFLEHGKYCYAEGTATETNNFIHGEECQLTITETNYIKVSPVVCQDGKEGFFIYMKNLPTGKTTTYEGCYGGTEENQGDRTLEIPPEPEETVAADGTSIPDEEEKTSLETLSEEIPELTKEECTCSNGLSGYSFGINPSVELDADLAGEINDKFEGDFGISIGFDSCSFSMDMSGALSMLSGSGSFSVGFDCSSNKTECICPEPDSELAISWGINISGSVGDSEAEASVEVSTSESETSFTATVDSGEETEEDHEEETEIIVSNENETDPNQYQEENQEEYQITATIQVQSDGSLSISDSTAEGVEYALSMLASNDLESIQECDEQESVKDVSINGENFKIYQNGSVYEACKVEECVGLFCF